MSKILDNEIESCVKNYSLCLVKVNKNSEKIVIHFINCLNL